MVYDVFRHLQPIKRMRQPARKANSPPRHLHYSHIILRTLRVLIRRLFKIHITLIRVAHSSNQSACNSNTMNKPKVKQKLLSVAKEAKAGRSLAALFSSKSTEWATPDWLFQALNREFAFDLDPASTHANAKTPYHFTKAEDGLKQSWGKHTVFCNPPFGREISLWVSKAHQAAQEGATVVLLIPARTDTSYWHRFVMQGAEIRFLRGRLTFGEAKHPAPFPSSIIIFRPPTFRLVSMVNQPQRNRQRES